MLKKIRCQDCAHLLIEKKGQPLKEGFLPVPNCFVYDKNINNPTLKHHCKYFCIKCECCEYTGDGIWKLIIFKRYRGSYGKKVGPICHDCLSNSLIGYHTGGGLVGNAIKKIKRVYKKDTYLKRKELKKKEKSE